LATKIPLDVVNGQTGEIIIPANRKITKTLLRKLAAVSKHVEIDPSPVRIKIMEIIGSYQGKFDELEGDRERKIQGVEAGEDCRHRRDQAGQGLHRHQAASWRSVIRWPAATVIRVSSPRSFPRKTCRSFRTVRRSRSA
jgi:hypothetical protein